jgi:hypothetical protein
MIHDPPNDSDEYYALTRKILLQRPERDLLVEKTYGIRRIVRDQVKSSQTFRSLEILYHGTEPLWRAFFGYRK